MAQQVLSTSRNILAKLLPVFEKIEPDSVRFKESLAALQNINRIKPLEDFGDLSLDDGSRRNLFHLLATCLNEARILKSDHLWEAFSILADVSREPKCRQDFGERESHSTSAGWPPDPKHESYGYSHEQWSAYESECILQVAVRTLHPRSAENLGQAAYHSLRLISNCCADNDANKRVVLECGGIELLLRCANMKLWPDVVTPALWNICADTEVQAGVETGTALGDDGILEKLPQMSLIACTQLALRSIGECDDSKGKSLLAAEIEDGRRHKNIVQELLDLADVVKGETWKEMAAELLEKASWSSKSTYLTSSARQAENLHAVSCLSNSDRKIILPHSTRLTRPQIRPKDILSELLTGSGRRLAMTNPECNGDVTRTIAVLLSDAEMQRELIHDDLLELFLEVPNWGSISSGDDERNPGAPRAKAMVQQSLFKTTYDVTALPEFTARFGKGNECPKLVTACIDALRDVSNLRQTKKAANSVPAASACVVLANLTKSTEYALFLVQRKNVHLSLGLILRQREDTVTLFPAIALLDRLAIPPENKTAMFGAGIIYELPRFLTGFDVQPRIQREAVSVIRKIILGHPQHVSGIGLCIPVNAQEHAQDQKPERIQEQSGLLAALNLFRRTTEVETKIEIGRLVIEVCRTLLHSTGGHSERAENAVHQAFGSACDIANPVTYLACNGPSEEVRGEGWFGLAVLSTWEHGRPFVMECLTREEVQKSMDEAMKNGDRTFGQNISLMLTRLHHFPSRLVLPSTREFLEHAASNAGLPPIWPVLALAA